jgi:hypothetical protein
MPTTVRTTTLQVWFYDPPAPAGGGLGWVRHPGAFAATCSFGFDQRYAEAEVRTTNAAAAPTFITYWTEVRIDMGCTPGAGVQTRFRGYVVPLDTAAYPIEGTIHCKGRLYRAEFVKSTKVLGYDFSPAGTAGIPDEQQVQYLLYACSVPYTAANIAGTGKKLGSMWINLSNVLPPGPFTWAEGQSGLSYIEQLDEMSVPDPTGTPPTSPGRYRTIESLDGTVYRYLEATAPAGTADFTFTEGVDVLEARIARDPTGAANRITVTGAPMPTALTLGGTGTELSFSSDARFTVGSATAPYLPPGLPNGPEGYPEVTFQFSNPLIEKSTIAQFPTYNVVSAEAVANFLLGEYNAVLDTLEFSTPRDDLLSPGQTIHLQSPRLGLTDTTRHYWLQHLDIELDERGQFTQRLRLLRKS